MNANPTSELLHHVIFLRNRNLEVPLLPFKTIFEFFRYLFFLVDQSMKLSTLRFREYNLTEKNFVRKAEKIMLCFFSNNLCFLGCQIQIQPQNCSISSGFFNFLTVYRITPNIANSSVFCTFRLGNLKNLQMMEQVSGWIWI